jgi:hypothetical protein
MALRLEFERMLLFKKLHCGDFGGFTCEKNREVS